MLEVFREQFPGEFRRAPHHEAASALAPGHQEVRLRIIDHLIGLDQERSRSIRFSLRTIHRRFSLYELNIQSTDPRNLKPANSLSNAPSSEDRTLNMRSQLYSREVNIRKQRRKLTPKHRKQDELSDQTGSPRSQETESDDLTRLSHTREARSPNWKPPTSERIQIESNRDKPRRGR